jgi:TubC N-terminal docking domain
MTGVHELLDRLKQLGATLSAEGDRLIVRAGSQAVPAELITEIRRAKAEVLESISPTKPEAQFWKQRLLVLTRDWSAGNRDLDSAAKLARENLINEWHAKYGKRAPAWQCVGCGKLIGGIESITLPDGNRVHLEPIDCMIAFGRRWRAEAKDALLLLGVRLPEVG